MNELSKKLSCVVMRSGVELWIESERAENLTRILETVKESKFIAFDGQLINTADITGIFDAQIMEDRTRRKNGQWLCNYRMWHQRLEKCECKPRMSEEEKQKYYDEHGYYPLQ